MCLHVMRFYIFSKKAHRSLCDAHKNNVQVLHKINKKIHLKDKTYTLVCEYKFLNKSINWEDIYILYSYFNLYTLELQ